MAEVRLATTERNNVPLKDVVANPELAARYQVSESAAKEASAGGGDNPFTDGVFARLVGRSFAENIGVRLFGYKDQTGKPVEKIVYSIIVNIYADEGCTQLIRDNVSLWGRMLRKTDFERTNVPSGEVVPFAEGSLNLFPQFQGSATLEEFYNAIVSYLGGTDGVMRVVSTPYIGYNRRGQTAQLHAISLVKL